MDSVGAQGNTYARGQMKKIFHAILFFAIAVATTQVHDVHGQTDAPQMRLLDRNGKSVTSIVDGNRIHLRFELNSPVEAETKIAFTSPNLTKPIAECAIQASSQSCETVPFFALGWYWDPDGSPKPERRITASMDGTPAEGSLNVSVKPRPVVMVHGFNSTYKTWTAYLGPQGF